MKKRFFSILLVLCLIIPCFLGLTACEQQPANTFDVWDGTVGSMPTAVESVYEIKSSKELAAFASAVNSGTTFDGQTVKLSVDIDLNNKEWTPIGYGASGGTGIMDSTDSNPFKGVFDGQNHTIKNLKITNFVGGSTRQNVSSGVALFGHIYNATVKNINVVSATISGNHYVSSVVGWSNGSTVDNCNADNVAISCVYANEDESGDKAGAVVAQAQNNNTNNSIVKNCSAKNSTVNADRDAGQVIGCLSTNNYGAGTQAEQTNNTSTNVIVSWNESGKNTAGEGYTKGNANIKNEVVGRIA